MNRLLKRSFMTEEMRARLKRLLVETSSVLARNNLTYWIDFGVLLGAYRAETLIAGDADIDLRVMHEDWQAVESALAKELPEDLTVTALHHAAVIHPSDDNHVTRWFKNDDGEFPIALREHFDNGQYFHSATALAVHFTDMGRAEKPNLDLYCSRINEHHDCMPDDVLTPWLNDGKRYLCLPTVKPGSQVVPWDYVFPLTETTLDQRSYPAPCQPQKYLERIYGYIGADAIYDNDINMWIKSPDGQPRIKEVRK